MTSTDILICVSLATGAAAAAASAFLLTRLRKPVMRRHRELNVKLSSEPTEGAHASVDLSNAPSNDTVSICIASETLHITINGHGEAEEAVEEAVHILSDLRERMREMEGDPLEKLGYRKP